MRETPLHIRKALKAYDKDLELRWYRNAWFIFWKGKSVFVYRHKDGSEVTDPVESELMDIIEHSDNFANADTRMQEYDRMDKVIQEEKKISKDKILAEQADETMNICEHAANPKIIV